MDINQQFPSKYLKASEVGKRPRRYVMEDVTLEQIGSDNKMILYFKGEEKGLVLNKTNSNAIAYIYGPETDGWRGNAINLYSTMVDYQGRPVEAIRTMPPAEEEQPIRRPATAPTRPISQQAAPRPRVDLPARAWAAFDQADEFPGDRPPLDAYDPAEYEG